MPQAGPRSQADRFLGCLLGACLGDALGFVVEGHAPSACRAYVDSWLRTGRVQQMSSGHFPFGQYSDDAVFAREIVMAWVAGSGRLAPEAFAESIARLYASNQVVGRAPTTEAAARRLLEGAPWRHAAQDSPEEGQGTAVRGAMLGVLEPLDRNLQTQQAITQSRITHSSDRCAAGAAASARAVSLAYFDQVTDRQLFLADLASTASEVESGTAGALTALEDWLDLEPEEAHRQMTRTGLGDDHNGGSTSRPTPAANLLWSIYSFLRSPEDYWEVVCTAIAAGGDVDTTAALAGAMAGAQNGLSALPTHLVACLHDQQAWRYGELVELGLQAWRLRARGASSRGTSFRGHPPPGR